VTVIDLALTIIGVDPGVFNPEKKGEGQGLWALA
jgi:hypothetical protein